MLKLELYKTDKSSENTAQSKDTEITAF